MSKMHIVQKLYADGRVEDVVETMTLKDMQAFVGGYIEQVRTRLAHRSLIINDEGMLDDLPKNTMATSLVHPDVLMLDGIRGNALLIKS